MQVAFLYCVYSNSGLATFANGTQVLIVAGGYNGNELSSTEILNLDSVDQWSNGPNLPIGLREGSSVPFKDTFLIIGGYDFNDDSSPNIYEYDVRNEAWITREEKLTTPRRLFAAFLIPEEVARCT